MSNYGKYYGLLTVIHSTFSGNSASAGAGIYGNETSLHLINSIVANSLSESDCYSNAPLATDVGNIIENNNGCGSPANTADPVLGPLADNGSDLISDSASHQPEPLLTHSLLPGSPAIDQIGVEVNGCGT